MSTIKEQRLKKLELVTKRIEVRQKIEECLSTCEPLPGTLVEYYNNLSQQIKILRDYEQTLAETD